MELIKVVVHYVDGRVIKGFTNNFLPNRPTFHLHPEGGETAGRGAEVVVKDLKAVFFVKDFKGDPAYNEQKTFAEGRSPAGKKVEVTFVDGEMLVGATLGYDETRPGFFIVTPDPKSNNLRVFVVASSVKGLRWL